MKLSKRHVSSQPMAQQDRSGAQPTSEKKQVNCRLQQV